MAYINKEQTAEARKIANKIAKRRGFKVSVSMKDHCVLNVRLTEGRAFTLNDFDLEGYQAKFYKKVGLGKFDYTMEDEFEDALSEFANVADVSRELNKYLQISEHIVEGWGSHFYHFKGEIKEMMEEIEREIKKKLEFRDKSDTMTDYHDVSFYYYQFIGNTKPYKEVA